MKIRKNVALGPYTRFHLGGTAGHFAEVTNWRDLLQAVTFAKKESLPYYIIAGGSNLAIADGILPALFIRIKESTRLGGKIIIQGRRVRVDASVQLWALVQGLMRQGFAGLQRLSGIPGTLGGAVVGNAGAYGVEIREYITRVRVYDGKRVRWITNAECNFTYRHSIFKEEPWLVLEAEFKLPKGDPKELKAISDDTLLKRAKFKWDMKTPGSYFKNIVIRALPERILRTLDSTKFIGGKVPVGYLLEAVGSKGYRVGGIYVSDFHANVFINDGTGRYEDLVMLITELKKRVKERFNITIEEEVRRVDHSHFAK